MRLVKLLVKFIEAVWVGWLFLGATFILLDWWVSTEMEFLSTKGEWEFLGIWLISLGIYFAFKHKIREKSRGYSKEERKIKREI